MFEPVPKKRDLVTEIPDFAMILAPDIRGMAHLQEILAQEARFNHTAVVACSLGSHRSNFMAYYAASFGLRLTPLNPSDRGCSMLDITPAINNGGKLSFVQLEGQPKIDLVMLVADFDFPIERWNYSLFITDLMQLQWPDNKVPFQLLILQGRTTQIESALGDLTGYYRQRLNKD